MAKFTRVLVLPFLLLAPLLNAQGITDAVVSGNTVTAKVALPGVAADLTLTFEQAEGLDLGSLGLSAELVDPAALQSRLGSPLLSVPLAFPVVVKVRPPAARGLAFHGVYRLGLHTENLDYVPGTPFRLLRAPDGGTFADITEQTSSGSYRVRGAQGSFSEFVIAADPRALDSVIRRKFDDAQGYLEAQASRIAPSVLGDLRAQLSQARRSYESGDAAAASRTVAAFERTVLSHSGAAIPDLWKADGSKENVGGRLRGFALTLVYSLDLKPAGVSLL